MLMPPLQLQTMSSPQTPLQSALRACVGSFALVFAYSCSYNLLLLAPSIYLLQIYDRVLSSRSGHTLLMLTIIVAFTVVIGGVLDALRRAALGRMGEWLEQELHPATLSACLKCAHADRARASDAYRDLGMLRQLAQSGACSTLFDALWTPLFLGVLFLVHPLLGVIGVLSVLFLLGLGLVEERLTEAPMVRSAGALSRSQGWFGTAIGNLHVIRAMGMLDGAARLIRQAAQYARREQEVVQRRHETIMLISKPARALAQVLVMGAAAWLVLEQNRSPGDHIRHDPVVRTRARAGRRRGCGLESMCDGARRLPPAQRRHVPCHRGCERRRLPGREGRSHRQQCRRRRARIAKLDAEGCVIQPRAR